MNIEDALLQACANVGINPPKARAYGKWIKTDTQSGKNGHGDGRVIINDRHVTAWNWQTGETVTVGLGGKLDERDRREIAKKVEASKRKKQQDAARAAQLATAIIAEAKPATHAYLALKGFRDERTLTISRDRLAAIVGDRSDYLFPADARTAIVVPARIAQHVSSVQLIWEDGTKKFLFGGTIEGACHRVAAGVDTWLCEGFATGLSIRAALQALKVRATVLCCFSAANIVVVARQQRGRTFVAAENDKPLPQFDGLGTSEHYVQQTGLPYGMPPRVGTDFNDLHQHEGVFALQRALTTIMASARRGAA